MEMFLAGVVRDSEHGEVNEELTRDEFKGLVCTEGTQMSSALEMFTVSLTDNPDTVLLRCNSILRRPRAFPLNLTSYCTFLVAIETKL